MGGPCPPTLRRANPAPRLPPGGQAPASLALLAMAYGSLLRRATNGGVKFETRNVETSDGLRLHVESWRPEADAPKFAVCVVHGGAEHVSRYERLAEVWTGAGGIVFGPDHRGQGRSEGPRGHTPSFSHYARDVRSVLESMRSALPDDEGPTQIPWFLFGHSMGGLITLTYLLDYAPWNDAQLPIRGALVSAPLIEPALRVPAWKALMGKALSRLAPKIPFPSGIEASDVSRDAEITRTYQDDPRRADVFTPGWLSAMERGTARVKQEAHRIQTPMLWYQGTADRLCDHQATFRLFETLDDPKKYDQTVRRFDGYYHELHNEPPELRAPIETMLREWIEART